MSTDWVENDDGFRRELLRGRRAELAVGLDLLERGFRVYVGRCEMRGEYEERGAFHDEIDIEVQGGHVLEIKSRSLAFTGPDDYPYPTAFVCAKKRWERRKILPCAIVLVSEKAGGRVVINSQRSRFWAVETANDSLRGYAEEKFVEQRGELLTYDRLLEHLRSPHWKT